MTTWSPTQYLKFASERNTPAQDLLTHIPIQSPTRIVDLGCGPGNSTALLAARYNTPSTTSITGIDSSPDMINKANTTTTADNISFAVGAVESYTPDAPVDLYFSNAVLQWLPKGERLQVIKKLVKGQKAGGVFAFQMPDTLGEPSHVIMREVAERGPWAEKLRGVGREEVESLEEIYDVLVDGTDGVEVDVKVWRTVYYHALDGHGEIVEWVRGTGLRPYLERLGEEEQRGFLEVYEGELRERGVERSGCWDWIVYVKLGLWSMRVESSYSEKNMVMNILQGCRDAGMQNSGSSEISKYRDISPSSLGLFTHQ
ncbi:S-adenosyl-L-methionine-dependent methyltransferase [Aspergillus sclerotioniger CBS 115572]|uniref:S-adenosyl-L-methionine-dependent methyltransferase n=1 Tax=Aspergillus sclerotioniger CBS 115572 TaxID=1450535 RepID=A0A317V9X4_9EURO|nr:S-adenosyl-L-methionine-dependent methyltransferase [Aspergillus sclerotioniger CBS 115572]PWY71134.1 S-adenosyl-L-methionine-dependent methyltransferase [Aspergillus sclerotioniger CBS 115572]